MRRLVIDIQKSANQGGRKVGIIFEADRMNRQSANAFLKTLEEPPAGTTLFLLTTRPYDLLDTIRSRCLNFRVPDLDGAFENSAWLEWTRQYRAWLAQILQGPNKKSVPDLVLGACGLNARYQQLLKELTQAAWNRQKENSPKTLTPTKKTPLKLVSVAAFANNSSQKLNDSRSNTRGKLKHSTPDAYLPTHYTESFKRLSIPPDYWKLISTKSPPLSFSFSNPSHLVRRSIKALFYPYHHVWSLYPSSK